MEEEEKKEEEDMFHVPYDFSLYCCAGLKMVPPQIERERDFNFEANGYALCYKNPRKWKNYSKC